MNPVTYISTGPAPVRIVVPMVPGTRSVLEFEWHAGTEPIDQTGTDWTCVLHDGITGEPVMAYEPDVDAELVSCTASEDLTALLDPDVAYEVRLIRVFPGPDLLAAGPVLFEATTIPVVAA